MNAVRNFKFPPPPFFLILFDYRLIQHLEFSSPFLKEGIPFTLTKNNKIIFFAIAFLKYIHVYLFFLYLAVVYFIILLIAKVNYLY